MNHLVYVDAQMVRAITAKLVGSELRRDKGNTLTARWSFLIQTSISTGESSSIMNDLREYLPEDIVHELYPKISDDRRFDDVSSAVNYLSTHGLGALVPGNAISISGNLSLPGVGETLEFDPFQPIDIEFPTFKFHQEDCFAGILNGGGYQLPVYFLKEAVNQVAFCHGHPVELTGIVRWSPGYRPKGGKSLNLALRVAAIWLK